MSQESTGIHWLLSDTNFILSRKIKQYRIKRVKEAHFGKKSGAFKDKFAGQCDPGMWFSGDGLF